MPILINFNSVCSKPSLDLEKWLYYDQPLTDKLSNLSGDAKLKLLFQNWVESTDWDKKVLGINEKIFQREIFMTSHNDIFWYARTIIPFACYSTQPDFFNNLNKESVRKLIFNNDKVHLVQRVVYSINTDFIEFDWMKKYLSSLQGEFWVRLAEFKFQNNNSFYLIEILFPQLEKFE